MGWNAETRITALLFSSSAALLLLARRAAIADLLLAALDRFLLDGRGLLDLATRRNMVLLCHAILLIILRDAGVLGSPARRRGATTATTAAAASVADSEQVCSASAPPRPRANSIVVWRRPPNGAAAAHDAGRQLAGGPRLAEAVAPWAAPEFAWPSPAEEAVSTTKEIVLVEQAATNHLAGHDRPAAVELDQQAAAVSATEDGKESEFDRRIVVADDGERNESTETEQTEETPELADDRRIEEFIAKQWSKMRQESLQLVVRSGSQQATATW